MSIKSKQILQNLKCSEQNCKYLFLGIIAGTIWYKNRNGYKFFVMWNLSNKQMNILKKFNWEINPPIHNAKLKSN